VLRSASPTRSRGTSATGSARHPPRGLRPRARAARAPPSTRSSRRSPTARIA